MSAVRPRYVTPRPGMSAVTPFDTAATRPVTDTGLLKIESFRPPTGSDTVEAMPEARACFVATGSITGTSDRQGTF